MEDLMSKATTSRLSGPFWLACAGVTGFLAVAIGAMGAHALKAHLSAEAMALYRTAWEYQTIHAITLTLGGLLALLFPQNAYFVRACMAWFSGILLFSGSLYAVSLGAPHSLVHITPFGGFSLMAGWILFAIGGLRLRKNATVGYHHRSD